MGDAARDRYRAMERLADERREEHGLRTPPINVYAVLAAEAIEVDLWPFSSHTMAGCYVMEPSVPPSIAINSGHGHLKRRFTAAHEYKHHLMDSSEGALYCDNPNSRDRIEQDANAFAARFLVPPSILKSAVEELGDDATIHALAELFAVNYPTAVYALHNTHLIDARMRDRLLSASGQAEDLDGWLELKRATGRSLPKGRHVKNLRRILLSRRDKRAPRCASCGALELADGPCWRCGSLG